jgi:flavin-dependent dehydrogenase
MYDLIVIGGGPAGSSAAITAARSGARVLLLERGKLPRHKVCGEFVSAESLDTLAQLFGTLSAELLQAAVRIRQARVYVDGRILETVVDPPAASIARLEMDAALWQSATEIGVDARQEVTVQSIRGAGTMLVATSAGGFEAQAVINTSGRWSNLNAHSINGETPSRWIGLKAHFAEAGPPASVDLYFFEGGYCGVQPVDLTGERIGRVNACAMVRADAASTLPEVFALHPALRERSQAWRALSDPVSTSPLLFREPQPERDGILMAGDAAGFVDPFVGDGISLALRTGKLAAECLVPFFAGKLSLAEARGRYVQAYQRNFAPVFRAASRIRRAMQMPGIVRRPMVAVLQRVPSVTRYLVKKTR